MKGYFKEERDLSLEENQTEFFIQEAASHKVATSAHVHEMVEILYGIDGDFTVTLNGETFFLDKGDLILFRSNSIHYVKANEKEHNSYYVIKCAPALLFSVARTKEEIKALFFYTVTRENSVCLFEDINKKIPEIDGLIQRLKRESDLREAFSGSLIRSYTIELLILLFRISEKTIENEVKITSSTAERIYDSLLYISHSYGEDITADNMAKRLSMSAGYFSRSFKEVTGKSFKDYLNSVRLSHAERELIRTDRSVSEISLECGYQTAAYFISVYKKYKGVTPGEARKIHNK